MRGEDRHKEFSVRIKDLEPEGAGPSPVELSIDPEGKVLKILSNPNIETGLLSITNFVGKEVVKGRLASLSINVSSLPDGVYTLTVLNGSGKFMQRFIKG